MVEAAAFIDSARYTWVCCLLACPTLQHPTQRAPVYVCGQEAQDTGLADNVGDVPLWHGAVGGLLPCRQAGKQGTASGRGTSAMSSPQLARD